MAPICEVSESRGSLNQCQVYLALAVGTLSSWAGFHGTFCLPVAWNHFDRGTIEVINPNADPNVESGGGPFARGRVPASAMGVWRTPKDEEYATPEALVGRKVRVYFDGDCTYFEAQV